MTALTPSASALHRQSAALSLSNPLAAAMAAMNLYYGWIVAGATFLVMLATAGAMGAPGVIIRPLEKEFGWSAADISSALALRIALFGLMAPFSAAFINRFGVRPVVTAAVAMICLGILASLAMTEVWQLVVLWGVIVGVGTGLVALVLGALLYGMSLATLFIFWLVFALLIRAVSPDVVAVRFSTSPRAALGMTFFFVIIIILSITGWFVTGTKLYADVLLNRAATREIPKQIDTVINELQQAASINQQSDQILRNLAQAYLVDIQQVLYDQSLDATARGQKVNSLTMAAVSAANRATVVSPKEVTNWSMLGMVYETVSAYASDAPANAIAAYTQASQLEPSSPVHHLELGRVHLILADRAAADASSAKDDATKATAQKTNTDELTAAETEFNKALSLKSDYAPASYQLALVYERQGKADDATKKLEEVAASNPSDAGVAFELGVLYYRAGAKDKAQAQFTRAIAITPDFANARWFLATVYEDAKNYTAALAQLNAILKTDPTNDTVKQRITAVTAESNGQTPPAPESGTTAPLPDNSTTTPKP